MVYENRISASQMVVCLKECSKDTRMVYSFRSESEVQIRCGVEMSLSLGPKQADWFKQVLWVIALVHG